MGWGHIPPSRFRQAILDQKQASPSRHTAMAPLSTNNPEYTHRQDTLGGGQVLQSYSSSPLPTTLRGNAGNPLGLGSHAASGLSMDPYMDALGVTKKTRHQQPQMFSSQTYQQQNLPLHLWSAIYKMPTFTYAVFASTSMRSSDAICMRPSDSLSANHTRTTQRSINANSEYPSDGFLASHARISQRSSNAQRPGDNLLQLWSTIYKSTIIWLIAAFTTAIIMIQDMLYVTPPPYIPKKQRNRRNRLFAQRNVGAQILDQAHQRPSVLKKKYLLVFEVPAVLSIRYLPREIDHSSGALVATGAIKSRSVFSSGCERRGVAVVELVFDFQSNQSRQRQPSNTNIVRTAAYSPPDFE
jgi:hypothetical protein